MAATADNTDLVAQINALKAQVDTLTRRSFYPMSVTDNAGVQLFSVQPSGYTDASGNSIPTTAIKDAQGNVILKQFPVAFDGGGHPTAWAWALLDIHGNQVMASDGLSGKGLAFPYIPVPMMQRFCDTSKVNSVTGVPAAGGGFVPQFTNSATFSGSPQTMYSVNIGKVSHPAINIHSVSGQASGGPTGDSYAVLMNGVSVGSWAIAPASSENRDHIFDISAYVGQSDVGLDINVQTTNATVGQRYCWLDARQAQTPPAFG